MDPQPATPVPRCAPAGTPLAVAAALATLCAAAPAATTAVQSSGSLSAEARYLVSEPPVGQYNFFTPADPLAAFSVGVGAVSTDLRNQSIEVNASASLSASWLDAAHGTVDTTLRWSASNVTNGNVAFTRNGVFDGWAYTVVTDVDSVFTVDFTQQFDAGSTTQVVSSGVSLYLDHAYIDATGVVPSGRLQVALPAGQAHEILLRVSGGASGPLGNHHTGLSTHYAWAITSAVPEAPAWALLACGLPALALRRRYSAHHHGHETAHPRRHALPGPPPGATGA